VAVPEVATAARDGAARTKRELVREHLLRLHDELAVGSAIPPERELTARLAVSRPTVRAAVDELVAEGYLERRQGSGTYVSRPSVGRPLTLMSFSDDMRSRGLRPGGAVLSLRSEPAGAKNGARLELSPRSRVWAIRRLRTADDEPMALETAHVPERLLPGLGPDDLDGRSLYELLRGVGIRVGVATQSIVPTVTTEEESRLLHVPELSPAFLFERTTRSQAGEVVEFVRSVYRGDRYRLVAELRPALR
jgi:GntR family transcriptional regulator